jgi:hypothetical protein
VTRAPRTLPAAAATAAAATAAAIALAGCGLHNPAAATTTTGAATSSTSTTAPASTTSAPTPAQINRQDHSSPSLERAQQAASSARPILPALPITDSGVTIDIAGLAPDGRTTILTLTSRLGRAHALAVYRRELRRYGDTGRAYRPRVRP